MSPMHETISPLVATIDFPYEGELVVSPHYTIRVTAPHARSVEISLDAGPWLACRQEDGHWWHDWTGYAPGAHVVCARVVGRDGRMETLRPRALRAALHPHGLPGVQNAAPESSGIERAIWLLRNQQSQFVQLWFTDVGGKPWRISVPVEHLDQAAFTAGVTLDGPSTSLSFRSYINLLPDPNAIFKDPLATVPTSAVICDLIEPPDVGAGLGVRRVLRSAVDALGQVEEGLTMTVGAEPEFFLLEADGKAAPEEDVWDFVCDLARTLGEAGIKSEGFRFGPAPGQGRVQMRWADPVRTADHVLLYRWFARVLARRRGKLLTFDPQPPSGEGAASMPTHTSLWLGVENAFHDAEGWQQTSSLCRRYVAGIVEHAAAVAALVATTESSYPLRAGSQASALRPYLSARHTDALCRVPERQLTPAGRRIKFRAGNANANPYLALAAPIMAGIDGIKREFEAPIEESRRSMPGSLGEALDALDADREFLKAGAFSDTLIDAWLAERRGQPQKPALEG